MEEVYNLFRSWETRGRGGLQDSIASKAGTEVETGGEGHALGLGREEDDGNGEDRTLTERPWRA